MKRTYRFAQPIGTVCCGLEGGRTVTFPVFPGILKHPLPSKLGSMLEVEAVARKYTREALRKAAWPLLREFPSWWLIECLDGQELRPTRRAALEFMLGLDQEGSHEAPG